jgi:hypothetical protein
MLAPVRCPFVRLQIVLSQDQSSTLEGHLHVYGAPLHLKRRWIRAWLALASSDRPDGREQTHCTSHPDRADPVAHVQLAIDAFGVFLDSSW